MNSTQITPSMPQKTESSTKNEQESGLSLDILIPIIIGSLLLVLIIICITVICIIRCLRRKKRKNKKLGTRPPSQNRSSKKSTIVAMIGSNENRQQPSTPSSLKSNADKIQIQIPPSCAEQSPSIPASSNLVPSKEKEAPPKHPPNQPNLLPLQQTQSFRDTEKSNNSFSVTARAAKHEKRDPRFPHLIPGTIEFMVAASQNIEQDSENLKRSGTVDDSKIVQFVNEH